MICKGAQGVLNIYLDNEPLDFTEDGCTIQVNEFMRQALSKGNYTVSATSPSANFTIYMQAEQRIQDFLEKCDAVLVIELVNGRVFTFSDANMTFDAAAFDAMTGKYNMTWVSKRCFETVLQGRQSGTTRAA